MPSRTLQVSAAGLVLLAALAPLAGCGPEDRIGWWRGELGAVCKVKVDGKGTKQVETDYIPHVVACENGAASTEALKAQAVAARSYMYYKVKKSGSICDGTGCQVYTCSNKPQKKHYDAAKATAGQVLMYSGVVICSFYVAGAKPTTSTCKALASDPDPTNTEKYVTYNAGKSGSGVTQSPLGWVNPGNIYNRGCSSQNGAHCLAGKGKGYKEILRFYYGQDIQLVTASGPCVTPPKPDAGVDSAPLKPDLAPPPPPPPADQGAPLVDLPPAADHGLPPGSDGTPPPYQPPPPGAPPSSLQGGCSLAAPGHDPAGWWVVIVALALLRPRAARPRRRRR